MFTNIFSRGAYRSPKQSLKQIHNNLLNNSLISQTKTLSHLQKCLNTQIQ